MDNSRQNKNRTTAIAVVAGLVAALWLVLRGTTTPSPESPTSRSGIPEPAATAPPTVTGEAETSQRSEHANTPTLSDRPALRTEVVFDVSFATPNAHRTDAARTVEMRVVRVDRDLVVGTATRECRGEHLREPIEVPPECWLRAEVRVDGTHLPSRAIHLLEGEQYELEFDCRGPVARLHVNDLSPALADQLRLAFVDLTRADPRPFELPLGRDAVVACRLDGPFRAGIVLDGDDRVPLLDRAGGADLAPGATTIEVIPAETVLGLIVRRRQRPIAAAIAFSPREPDEENLAECAIRRRRDAEAAVTIDVRAPALGWLRGRVADFASPADLWSIDSERLDRLGELVVNWDETPVTARVPFLVATRIGDDRGTGLGRNRSARLVAGDYRLTFEGVADAVAAEFVRIAAGETTRLTVTPFSLPRWSVRLLDPPPGLALGLLHDGTYSYGSSTHGTFEIDLAAAPRVGDATQVLAHTQQTFFPAEFVAVDTGTRRATVRSAIGSAIVTRLVGVPLQTGPTRFALLPSTAGLRVNDLPSPLDVPLPAGATRHGLMIDRVDDRPQLTRWFEFGTDGGEVSITPNGRWATLRFARKLDSARILCEGPGGELAQLAIPPSEQPIPLFVAAGTTAIHVDAPPLERQTFEPTLAEIVVR